MYYPFPKSFISFFYFVQNEIRAFHCELSRSMQYKMRFLPNFTTSSTSPILCLKSDSVTCFCLFLNHRALTSAMDLCTNYFYCLIYFHGSCMLSFIWNLTFTAIPSLDFQRKRFFFIPPDSITCFHFHYSPHYHLLFVYLFIHYLSLLYFMGQKTGHFCKQSIIKGSWQVLNEYI